MAASDAQERTCLGEGSGLLPLPVRLQVGARLGAAPDERQQLDAVHEVVVGDKVGRHQLDLQNRPEKVNHPPEQVRVPSDSLFPAAPSRASSRAYRVLEAVGRPQRRQQARLEGIRAKVVSVGRRLQQQLDRAVVLVEQDVCRPPSVQPRTMR